jgi:tRNA(Ser,Leu) C12 N-acetylase TAN1
VTARPVPATPTWNLLVTSLEGQREALLAALRPLARFRRGGFPNVLVATVDDPVAFLGVLRDACAQSTVVRSSLGKAIPIDRTLRLTSPEAFRDEVGAALDALADRLTGRTFFVRIFRRGFRGLIDSTRLEGELGARLVAALEARGDRPRVRFDDSDVALVIETLRDEVGIAVLDRTLRATHPFVRVR